MGDMYRPRERYEERRRDDDRYAHDSYRPEPPRRDYYPHDPYPPPPQYSFKGASSRSDGGRPPYDFTFDGPGPRFPRETPPPPQQSRNRGYEDRSRINGERPIDQARREHAENSNRGNNSRGNNRNRGNFNRGRPPFRPKAAHTRKILNTSRRETTPEQLEGMNADGTTRFREISDESSEGSEAGELADNAPRKRVKFDADTEPVVPKWSNPDPYTALPPPETLGAPKRDIVQVIRKAKVVAQNNSSKPVQESVDFISFNDFGDEASESDEESGAASEAPSPSTPLRKPAASGFSHRTDFHQTIPSASTVPARPRRDDTRKTSASMDVNGGPPAPPPGMVMPSDDELLAQIEQSSRGMPHRHRNERRSGKGAIVEEWERNDSDPTPWCRIDHRHTSNTAFRLHKEICDFYEYVRPHDYEEAVRRDLIDRIQRAVRTSSVWGASVAEVHCFGSFAAGLYLPTADMDLVIVTPNFLRRGQKTICQTGSQMRKLAQDLVSAGIAPPGGFVVIPSARVPLVKFADKKTGIKVDISFENSSGIVANGTFQKWKELYPAMPVVVVLIKQLLAMRGLNEVFKGGIGGFTIICLVVSMLQLMPQAQSGSMDGQAHYGELLMAFLRLYGSEFNHTRIGIRFNPPGYFDKQREPPPGQGNQGRLSIIDPNNRNNDISGGSSEIDAVLDIFKDSYGELQRRMADVDAGENVDSILEPVWGGNYTSFAHQRERLSLLHRGHRVSPLPLPAPVPTNGAANGPKRKRSKGEQSTQTRKARKHQTQSNKAPNGKAPNGRHQHPLPHRPTGR